MGYKKGTPKHPRSGRAPGQPNKLGAFAKEMALLVFEGIGGLPRFEKWASENPTEYYLGFLAKAMPKEVEFSGTLVFEHQFAEAALEFDRALNAVVEARRFAEAKVITGSEVRKAA